MCLVWHGLFRVCVCITTIICPVITYVCPRKYVTSCTNTGLCPV